MRREIDALLFDKDGTLFSFQATYGGWASDLVAKLTATAPERQTPLAEALGLDLEARRFLPDSAVIAGTEADVMRLMLPHLPHLTSKELLGILAESAAAIAPVEAVPLAPLMAELTAAGYRLGVATNDGESAARAQLGRIGVADAFEMILGYDSGHGGKPAPGQCLAFCDAMGVAPGRVAMIGDSLHDLRAAAAGGLVGVGVLSGPATADELSPMAEVVLPDIGHLPRWLGIA